MELLSERKGESGMDKAPCRGRRRCTRFSGLMGAVFEGLRENFTGLGPRFGLPGMPGIIG